MAKGMKKTGGAGAASAAPAAPDAQAAPVAGAGERVFHVATRRNGFRRCGLEWHGTTTVQESFFTAAQWEQLRNEPMLAVTEVEANEGV